MRFKEIKRFHLIIIPAELLNRKTVCKANTFAGYANFKTRDHLQALFVYRFYAAGLIAQEISLPQLNS